MLIVERGGLLGDLAVVLDRSGGAGGVTDVDLAGGLLIGGAFTGGALAGGVVAVEVEDGVRVSPTGGALKRIGPDSEEVLFGGVSGALTGGALAGAGGGFGVLARVVLLLVLLVDRDRCSPMLR